MFRVSRLVKRGGRMGMGMMGAVLTLVGCAAPKTVTTESLLQEMTDLRALAYSPHPAFTCRQFSSYDRASETPEDPDTWFANADWGQFIREEKVGGRTEYVMADMDGPGAIVRLWSANPKGTLRIYLDGSRTPEIECPMADFLGGKLPWNPSPISGERSRGWNSYFPIPYEKHCKVTCDQKEFYYHVNYRTYAPGTHVRSFSVADIDAGHRPAEVAATLTAGLPPVAVAGEHPWIRIEPGQSRTIWNSGRDAGSLTHLFLRFRQKLSPSAARRILLRISFDGRETVTCPVVDFFGTGPGLSPFQSLPCGVSGAGDLWCNWVMPYRREVVIRLDNLSDAAVEVFSAIRSTPDDAWRGKNMYFHARTRIRRDVPTRPMIDWNYLTVAGRGVFVGAAFNIANPVREWWGEGDEKIYVDGETFPSHFGTGTEDYYGYAWCCNVPFQHAYHNQPRCDGPHNYGWTSVNRWHILDKIPFEKSFKFDMELWHWNADTKVDLAVTAYWYARPGATVAFPTLDPADLVVREIPPYVAPRTAGAIEGEEMTIVEKAGLAEPQGIFQCSNESHLWWREGHKIGDRLVLSFPVPRAGTYNVVGRFVKAVDYGVHQLYVNGVKAGDPIDFFNNGVMVSDEMRLGRFELPQGENRLTVEVVGANEQAVVKYMFGLDYLRLEAAGESNGQ